ncbi:unnamed protein product [Allacma fusca]|uniref:DUF1989 domain-containing protein n=1 Tax=Allacma fusca TaxID=39272 RepID=A0A8J2KBX4_9HEXA|nr:unnamed protein product [Allacma fusca]
MSGKAWTYATTEGGQVAFNRDLYQTLGSLQDSDRRIIQDFTIPIRSGQAWEVKAGQVCRIVAVSGPQVGDFNVWNLHNPRERLWAARTRQLQSAHVKIYDRLWSNLPYLRPLLTVTGDSLSGYGEDSEGGRVHDLLGTRCDPYVHKMLTGEESSFSCHSNLTRAVLPHGLTELDVHDVLNVFQVTGLNEEDRYFMKSCPAKAGDYFEFFAEIDLLCALSVCPSGDQSKPLWGPEARDEDLIQTCRPLGVQVFEVNETILKTSGWEPPKEAYKVYTGLHGIEMPIFQKSESSP